MLVSALAAWVIYRERLNTLNKWGLLLAVVAIILIFIRAQSLNISRVFIPSIMTDTAILHIVESDKPLNKKQGI